MPERTSVRIVSDSYGRKARIEVNGVDVSNVVTGLDLKLLPRDLPEVTLRLLPQEFDITLDDSRTGLLRQLIEEFGEPAEETPDGE